MLVLPELLHLTMQPRKSSIFSPLIFLINPHWFCMKEYGAWENLLLSSFSSKSRKGRSRFYILISATEYLKFTLKIIYRVLLIHRKYKILKFSVCVYSAMFDWEAEGDNLSAFAFLNLICFVHLPLFMSAALITLKSGTQGSNYQIMDLFLNMQSLSSQV